MPLPTPLTLPYQTTTPVVRGPLAGAGAGAAILGRVTLGARAQLAQHAVMRADGHVIDVGDDFCLGVHSTIHIAHAVAGTRVGHRVTVGRNAVVHACTLGDDCVVEDDAVVLDGAVVGAGCVISSGSVVFSRAVLSPGQRYAGLPAVAVGAVPREELQDIHRRIRSESMPSPAAKEPRPACGGPGYLAMTVTGRGSAQLAAGSSLWFGCQIEGALGRIEVAEGSSVQDNSLLRSEKDVVRVGKNCTVGHNVLLHDSTVGDRVLVGMGSRLAPGTVVGDDVLVAAGSTTTSGQNLKAGWMWGGRPARPIAPLDERKRAMIHGATAIYVAYADDFAAAEADLRDAR